MVTKTRVDIIQNVETNVGFWSEATESFFDIGEAIAELERIREGNVVEEKPCGDEEWIPISQETLKVLNRLRRPKESYDMAIGYLIDLYETEKMLYERLGGKKL